MLRSLALPALALCAASCVQDIVVVECDGHETTSGDGGAEVADARAGDASAGDASRQDTGAPDAGAMDAAAPDATASPCGAMPYCIVRLDRSIGRVNVRESATLTPVIENPRGTALTFRVGALTSTRAPNRPPLVLSEITASATADASGQIRFVVGDVPPWFIATTFRVQLFAKGPSSSDPEVSAVATVHVRGNTVFSSGVGGAIYAIASDGRPATSPNAGNTSGALINSQSIVREPRGLLVNSKGQLIAYDGGTNPPRLRRFELTGENVMLQDFASVDGAQMQILYADNTSHHSIAELPDGKIVVGDYQFTRSIESYLQVWNDDGSYARRVQQTTADANYSSVSTRANGELLVVDRNNSNTRVLRFDSTSFTELSPPLADTIASGRAIVSTPDGGAYVGGDGFVLQISPTGGKAMVNGVPGGASSYWRVVARYDEGRVIAANDTQGSDNNIILVQGRTNLGFLRKTPGPIVQVSGLAYLE